jgi:hypothetical protein
MRRTIYAAGHAGDNCVSGFREIRREGRAILWPFTVALWAPTTATRRRLRRGLPDMTDRTVLHMPALRVRQRRIPFPPALVS